MAATKFEEIIVNPQIFKIILDEFFHDQESSFDIMPVEDPNSRLFKDHRRMADFCKRIRSSKDGLHRCMQCDIKFAKKAQKARKPLHYMCHAGLMDIAVPIVIGNELVATIFCGQNRSKGEAFEKEAIRRVSELEMKLGLKKDELIKLREKTPVLSDEQIEKTKNKLWEVAAYVSSLGSQKLEAEHAKRDIFLRLKETEAIQEILLKLSDIVDDVEEFWKRLDVVLEKICSIIGASVGLFVTYEASLPDRESRGFIQSVANLPDNLLGKFIPYDYRITEALSKMAPVVGLFSDELIPRHLFVEIEKHLLIQDKPTKIAIVPVKLEPTHVGAMIFLVPSSNDTLKGLEIQEELSLLTQAGTHCFVSEPVRQIRGKS